MNLSQFLDILSNTDSELFIQRIVNACEQERNNELKLFKSRKYDTFASNFLMIGFTWMYTPEDQYWRELCIKFELIENEDNNITTT